MSTITVTPLMTLSELLALPEDGTDRYLIRGQLREMAMTRRNRWHSRVEARIVHLLWDWLERQPEPRGTIASGEAGFILRRDPDTTVGIDVAYISAEVAARQPTDTTMFDGVPLLAVEILSPSDVIEEIQEKINEYLAAGVAMIWIVDPVFQTIQVHRPGQPPIQVNNTMDIVGDPVVPGFRVAVSQFFP